MRLGGLKRMFLAGHDWSRWGRHAVIASWVAAVIVGFFCLSAVMDDAIKASYFSRHILAPQWLARTDLWWWLAAPFLAAAIAATLVRWWFPKIAVAAALAAYPVAGLLYWFWLLPPLGPQTYSLYAGTQHFIIPWQYDPWGSAEPATDSSFSLRLNLPSLAGRFGNKANSDQMVHLHVAPMHKPQGWRPEMRLCANGNPNTGDCRLSFIRGDLRFDTVVYVGMEADWIAMEDRIAALVHSFKEP